MKKNQSMKPTIFVLVKGTAVAPKKVVEVMAPVSYTHLTLPTIA